MEPYLVISSDCHAGLPTEQYRPYVDPDQRAAFDDMLEARNAAAATRTSNEFADRWLAENAEGLTGAWDSQRRDKELDADGVVGEVIFPDADAVTGFTGAPFGAGIGSTGRLDPTLASAGARAHNRWLAELCAESPVRRVGVAIVPMLDDPVRGHRRGRVGGGQRPARGDDPRDVAAVPRVPRPALRPVLGGVRGCRPAGAHPLRSCRPRAVRPAHRHLPHRGAVVGGAPAVVPDLVRRVRASSQAQVRHHRGRLLLGQRHPLAHGHPLPGRAHLEEDEPRRHRRSSSP